MAKERIVIGAHQLSWGTALTREDLIRWMDIAQRLGCGAFEVFLSGKSSCGPATIGAVATRFGMKVIGLPVMTLQTDPLSITHPTLAADALKNCIKAVHGMGGSLVAGPLANVLGRTGEGPNGKQYAACINTFGQVAKTAQRLGVRLAIEPLQWSEIAWPNTCQQVIRLIRDVEETQKVPKGVFGVLFDIYHALRMEEDWSDSLSTLLAEDLLFHVHVAGPNRTPPRTMQHINWQRLVGQLKSAEWRGAVTIESFGRECDLPLSVVGPGDRLPAKKVIQTGVKTLRQAGL